jgi:hypothetical protein
MGLGSKTKHAVIILITGKQSDSGSTLIVMGGAGVADSGYISG